MKLEQAVSLRETLLEHHYVRGPEDDGGAHALALPRIHQPGYLNGDPVHEVLVDTVRRDPMHLPEDFISLVHGYDAYLRVDDGTVHIRADGMVDPDADGDEQAGGASDAA